MRQPSRFQAVFLPLLLTVLPVAGRQPPPAARTILATGSYWRVFAVRAPGVVPLEVLRDVKPDATEPKVIDPDLARTPPPADNWREADVDDSAWLRRPGPFSGGYIGWANKYFRQGRAMICLRGKFRVSDPDAAKLTLSLGYQGGVAVFLNGREIARGHLPVGHLAVDTPGEVYPKDAYLDAEGGTIPFAPERDKRIAEGDKELARRVALRTARRIGPIPLPPSALRKGVNVLAIEIHRSVFRPEAAGVKVAPWSHVGLVDLSLQASGPDSAVEANLGPTAEGGAWNAQPIEVFGPEGGGDPCEPLRPIRLVGARNGFYSGQIVLRTGMDIVGLRAVAGDLTGDAGAKIPSEAVEIGYPSLSRTDRATVLPGYRGPAFAGILDAPPAKVEVSEVAFNRRWRDVLGLPPDQPPGAVQPIWVRVKVPKDAPAGKYKGRITISASGLPAVNAEVELEAVDWTLPDAGEMTTIVGLYASPETEASHYKVKMWSPEHWSLLAKQWRLLGYCGNNLLIVPLVNHTQFGNDECLIPWIPRKDVSFEYDFTVYDRLVKLAMEHARLRVISYQVCLPNDWTPPVPDKPTYVTVVEPDGSRGPMKLPAYGTDESRAMWKALGQALRDRNDKLGVGKGVVTVLGVAQDGGVHKTVLADFATTWPGVKWHYAAHGRPAGGRMKPYDLAEYLYVPDVPSPGKKRLYGWQNTPIVLMSQRVRDDAQWPVNVRTMCERALLLGDNGPGRFCLDYWPVPDMPRGAHRDSYFSRWLESSANQRTPHLRRLALPGADGPVRTVKIEAFREGLQLAEVRVFLEKALVDGRLTAPLTERCRRMLDERATVCQATNDMPYMPGNGPWTACNDLSTALAGQAYRLAAQVATELGGK